MQKGRQAVEIYPSEVQEERNSAAISDSCQKVKGAIQSDKADDGAGDGRQNLFRGLGISGTVSESDCPPHHRAACGADCG